MIWSSWFSEIDDRIWNKFWGHDFDSFLRVSKSETMVGGCPFTYHLEGEFDTGIIMGARPGIPSLHLGLFFGGSPFGGFNGKPKENHHFGGSDS